MSRNRSAWTAARVAVTGGLALAMVGAGALAVSALASTPQPAATLTYTARDLGSPPFFIEAQTPFGDEYSPTGVTSDGSVLYPYSGLLVNGVYELPANEPKPLPTDVSGSMQMLAVSDSKTVVGFVNTNGREAAVWRAGASTNLSVIDFSAMLPSDATAGLSYANVVDNAGEVGGAVTYTTPDGTGNDYFYLPSPTAAPVLSTDPSGGGNSMILSLNYPWELAQDESTGAIFRYNRVTGQRDAVGGTAITSSGTVLNGGTEITAANKTIVLAVPAGDTAYATTISNAGVAAGLLFTAAGKEIPGVWDRNGVFTDLSSVAGTLLLSSPLIGRTGLIVAMHYAGVDSHAYLLSPGAVPPPIVNSTADGAAVNDGASGCDTGGTVTVNGKSQPECTLRAAIEAENASSVADKTITFALAASLAPSTIQPKTPLPALTADGVTIDGTTAPTGLIEINGFDLDSTASGLHISGGQDIVQGFTVANLTTGILIDSAQGADTVRGCVLGISPYGSTEGVREGVDIENSPNNLIGGTGKGARNVLSGLGIGVLVHKAASTGNKIQGNYLGTDVTGSTSIGDFEGIAIIDASNNLVGGTTTGSGNVIVGRQVQTLTSVSDYGAVTVGGFGVNATGNIIQGNKLAVFADGTTPASDSWGSGVLVLGRASGTIIGGSSAAAANVIGATTLAGVWLDGTNDIGSQVLGNLIGTDSTGKIALGHGNSVGVLVSGARNSTIGNGSGGGNVITSEHTGIETLQAPMPGFAPLYGNAPYPGTQTTVAGPLSTLVVSNTIGPFADGKSGPSSSDVQQNGVVLAATGDTVGPNNLISFNQSGVLITTLGETVAGNDIGTDSTGTDALPNGNGVLIGAKGLSGFTLGSPGAKPNTVSGNVNNLIISSPTRVQNTHIGTTTLGNAALNPYAGKLPDSIAAASIFDGTGFGIVGLGPGDVIGGTQPGDGNVVSGNAKDGIIFLDPAIVEGNLVGVGADGVTPVPNGGNGIDVGSPSQVGGSPTANAISFGPWAPGFPVGGNTVANNGGKGISIDKAANATSVLSNSVYANAGGGIVHESGPVPGPSFTNSPTQDGMGHTVATISVDHAASGTIVQVYVANSCTAVSAQGRTLLQTDTINGPGSVVAKLPVQAVGTELTATVSTAQSGIYSTSDFSSCATVSAAGSGLTSSSVPAGQPDSASATGFAPEEQVDTTLHSTPVDLGRTTVDKNGAVTVNFIVPADTVPGAHEIVLTGLTSKHVVSFPITVTSATLPTATPQSITTAEGASVGVTLAGHATSGAPLSYQVVSSPSHGQLTGVASNLIYHPVSGYTGTDSFTFTVTAGGATSLPAKVTITITKTGGSCGTSTNHRDVFVSSYRGSSSTSITSPAFSTCTAEETLVALVFTDSSSHGPIKRVTGGGLTWTLYGTVKVGQTGTIEIWQSHAASAVSDVAVTATLRVPSPQTGIVVASFTSVATLVDDLGSKANAFSIPTILTTAFNVLLADYRPR